MQGLWAQCESISIFEGVIEYEILFRLNAHRTGFDLKVSLSLCAVSNKSGLLIQSTAPLLQDTCVDLV